MNADAIIPLRFDPSVLIEVSFSHVDRSPFRTAHLEHIASLLICGQLRLAGATADIATSVMLFNTTASAAQSAVEADPYWQNGVWHDMNIRDFLHAVVTTESEGG